MERSARVWPVALLLSACGAAGADIVLDWNRELLNTIKATNTAPPVASRAMAMTHVAVYEAVNSVDRGCSPYRQYLDCPAGTSREAAAAVAAHRVMSELFPTRRANFDQLLAAQLDTIQNGDPKTAGRQLGTDAGDWMLALRAADHSGDTPPIVPDGAEPGQWRRTPPGFQDPALPHWGTVAPWGVATAAQFGAGPRPSLTSRAYTDAYNQVKELGAANSATRTADQTDTAFLWRAGPNSVTPPGMWNQIAQQAAESRGLNLLANARLFALLGMAEADAAVTVWRTKYTELFWRPVTAIQLGGADTNDQTQGDPAWAPLFGTPNHPSYASGHSTFSAAAAAVLRDFIGTDVFTFTVEGDNRARQYLDFTSAMNEAGMSRIYGGIHWSFDNEAGLASGAAIGDWIFSTQLQVPAPATGALGLIGCLAAARRRRR
ncbi:MAG: vanadium-dependent haloperoxidase [Phycisphaerae bacterium]|nr:vanadium-dependent haloperoxidase [Phycisphaerae bacterium]